MTPARPRTIVICPFATPNGPLHVGHLAGPYLAADVHARYLRARGESVAFPSGTDENQTYVAATARRLGVSPEALCAQASAGVQQSLEDAGIAIDGFVPPAASYREAVLDFFVALHADGRLRLREQLLPWAEGRGEYLLDGLVSGECPVCLSSTCGGVCESCGHPIDYAHLRDLRCTADPDERVSLRPATVLVLPMEEYRDRLAAFHAQRPFRWRPHIEQLIEEMLAKPLLDLPITSPLQRGIPAPFPETPGQVINPWAEAMPQCMHGVWHALGGEPAGAIDEHWRADHGARIVYFLGYDNAPNWAMTYVALLMAHGERYRLPSAIVCNEFYELDHEKVSTSRGHAIWVTDLVAELPRDVARYYLALTSPESQRTSFSRDAVEPVVARQLVEPWNALADALAAATAALGEDAELVVSPEGRRRAARIAERFELCYAVETFSLTRAAMTLSEQLGRLRLAAEASTVEGGVLGDLVLEVQTLARCAAPLLVDAAGAVAGAATWPDAAACGASSVRLTQLPSMPTPAAIESRKP